MSVRMKAENLAPNKIENRCLIKLEAIAVAESDIKASYIICSMVNQTYNEKHCKILITFQTSL